MKVNGYNSQLRCSLCCPDSASARVKATYEENPDMAREKAHCTHSALLQFGDKNTPNPMMCKEGRGERNFACLHYDICLEKAAKGMWSGFTCKECSHFYQKDEEA